MAFRLPVFLLAAALAALALAGRPDGEPAAVAELTRRADAPLVLDVRTPEEFAAGHVPGAVSVPHRTMDEQSTAHLDRSKVYVTYCDGIGCNGSTRGAYKLARLGFTVKEMLGGLDFWIRDGQPVATGPERGAMPSAGPAIECAC